MIDTKAEIPEELKLKQIYAFKVENTYNKFDGVWFEESTDVKSAKITLANRLNVKVDSIQRVT